MKDIICGNFNKETKEHRGWGIGFFMNPDSPFKIKEFEVKWGRHKKGEFKKDIGVNKIAKTISILVYGKVIVNFPKQNRKVVLEKEGDYAFWGPNIVHSWKVEKDALVVTIRWPSMPNDQKKLKEQN